MIPHREHYVIAYNNIKIIPATSSCVVAFRFTWQLLFS